ncbi:MAG: hypothetical protein AAB388_03045 [Patescibacteria group bacterium]
MSKNAINIIIILGLLTVVVAATFIINRQSATTLSFASDDQVLQNMQRNSQLFLERKQELEQVEFNIDLLKDTRFTTLHSYFEPVSDIKTGRADPFAAPETGS